MITLFVPYIHKVDNAKCRYTSIKPDRSRILIYTPDILIGIDSSTLYILRALIVDVQLLQKFCYLVSLI